MTEAEKAGAEVVDAGTDGAVVAVAGEAGLLAVMLMLLAGDKRALRLLVCAHPAAPHVTVRQAAASIDARHSRHGLMVIPTVVLSAIAVGGRRSPAALTS